MIIPSTSSFTLNFSGVETKSSLCQALNKTMYAASSPPNPPLEEINRSNLQRKYGQCLKGRIFDATYMESVPLPITETLKDVLSINQGDGFFLNALRQISNDVLSEPYGPQVWKAITCPGDTPGQTDYRLWVEPIISGVIPSGSRFKVDE